MNTSNTMDIDRPNVPKRMMLIDPDTNQEVPQSKRPRIQLEATLKRNVIKYIGVCLNVLANKFDPTYDQYDLNFGIQIHSVFFSIHNHLRQKGNGLISTLTTKLKDEGFIITHPKKFTMKMDEGVKAITSVAEVFGFSYKKGETWIGTAAPIMDFIAGFSLRIQELRLGHSTYITKKDATTSQGIPVNKYGLYGCHHIMLEGVSFPPEKRSSMAQSIGSFTAMICLARSTPQYSSKWEQAVKRDFANFPEIDTIISLIRSKKAEEVRPLITALADLALIVTTRNASRMFFPPNFFMIATRELTIKLSNKNERNSEIIEAGATMLNDINFSGRLGFLFYQGFTTYDFKYKSQLTSDECAQVVFHAIFGTYKDDLSILRTVTYQGTWNTREYYGSRMQRPATDGMLKPFRLIGYKFYSKLASANQTGFLTSTYNQITTHSVFSGGRTMGFSEDFVKRLSRKEETYAAGRTLSAITSMIQNQTSKLIKEIHAKGNIIHLGTTKWFDMKTATKERDGDVAPDVELKGEFFLGKREN